MRLSSYFLSAVLALGAAALPTASESSRGIEARDADPAYWLKDIAHRGLAAFNSNPAGYLVFRNVKDFGAVGDGVADDTAAINAAISSFSLTDRNTKRCGPGVCDSSTTTPAVVYFPAGTYKISTSIVDYYYTQLIGNANSPAVLKATSNFQGLGLIDGNVYQSGGAQGWISTNVFFRQIRNLVLDMTAIAPEVGATGIHWASSQATSIQNVVIKMTKSSSSTHQGIFIENGSGGWLSDITTEGGQYGFNIGNQQYSMRNLKISGAIVGISQIWNWGWSYQGVTISDCGTAFDMSNGGSSDQQVGSVAFFDSTITNCPVFVKTAWTTSSQPPSAGSLVLENVAVSNVPVAVGSTSGAAIWAGPGTGTIASWGQGHRYALTSATASGPNVFQGSFTPVSRPAPLLASGTQNYYTKSKPQYEASPVASFLSVRAAGAKGDGITDDTNAIKSAITTAVQNNQILFFDHGDYKVTDTITFPAGSRVVGETYSVILASGAGFSNVNSPKAVVKVGNAGDSGFFEWSDMIVSTQGATAGAILIEWNLKASTGSGMWDVHTRIGGFAGSNLQTDQCLWNGVSSTANCMAAFMSMHITNSATGVYVENCWFWTADHDLDDKANNSTRVTIYTGRGMLVEGSNVWLYGTGVEHHALYQYYFANTQNIVTSYIQTETPYYMPQYTALTQPYPVNAAYNDPDYTKICIEGNCDSLGLLVKDSSKVSIYGAGLYSFFNSYSTSCSDKGNGATCQGQIFQVTSSSSSVSIYGLNTVGSLSMANVDGTSVARASDNINVYPQTISLFTWKI